MIILIIILIYLQYSTVQHSIIAQLFQAKQIGRERMKKKKKLRVIILIDEFSSTKKPITN